jgi:iron complex outermembrane recepter protein
MRKNRFQEFQVSSLRRSVLSSAIAAVAMMGGHQAIAQDDFAIEEIIVTAQKREQSLQDVPVAISAFSGEHLENASIKNLNEVVAYTPGLAGQNQTGNNLEHLSVRGVTSSDFGVGGDLSVGVYENGIYRPRSGGALGFYDMERVEILKGPQGLLFGRNATSGAISATTRRASEEFEGDFTVGMSERNGSSFTGAINLPITEDLSMRVAGQHLEEQGYVKNRTTGKLLLGTNNDEVRTSFRYVGFEDTTIDLVLDYSDIERSSGETYSRTTTALSGLPLDLVGLPSSDDPYTSYSDFGGKNDSEFYGAMLEINTDLSDTLTLTSLTGYREARISYGEDFDAVDIVASHFNSDTKSEYFSQELRLNYTGERVTWFAGISAYDQNVSSDFVIDADSDAVCHWGFGADCVSIMAGGGTGDASIDGLLTFVNGYVAGGGSTAFSEISSISGKNKGWAVYGDATFTLTEELDLSIGARYTYDEKEYEREALPTANPAVALAGLHGGYYTDGTLKSDDDWNDFSPRIALSYIPNDNLNLYATISKGYKAGGFDSFGFANTSGDPTVALTSGDNLNSFDPEEILSYELGIKSRWLDSRLQVNASTYYYDYEDMQLISRQGNAFVIQNVGEATGQGVELEVRYLPGENWDLFLGAAYSDTESNLTDQENSDLCGDGDCDGKRLPYNPRLTTITAINYQSPLAIIDGVEFFATAEHSYQESSFSGLENLNTQESDSIELVNLRAGLVADQWRLTFYVENLEDKTYFNQVESTNSGSFQTVPSVPRTAGVKINLNF